MIGHVGVHRANHRDVVDALRDVRKNLTHFNAALSILLELVWGWKRRAGFAFGAEVFHRERFARVFCERGLRIECIDV